MKVRIEAQYVIRANGRDCAWFERLLDALDFLAYKVRTKPTVDFTGIDLTTGKSIV